jgi:hypothetical protein
MKEELMNLRCCLITLDESRRSIKARASVAGDNTCNGTTDGDYD